MGFSFIDIINKDVEGKETTGTMGIEVPATIAYAEATTICSQKQFKANCFKGEGKMTRAILSFPIWFSTSKLTVCVLFSEKFLMHLLTSGYLGMLSLIRVKYVALSLGNRLTLEEDSLQNLGPSGFPGFSGIMTYYPNEKQGSSIVPGCLKSREDKTTIYMNKDFDIWHISLLRILEMLISFSFYVAKLSTFDF
ncbi:hypothetical protein V6N12_006925 [Hibiscus sabdariffa]|uniref:Uncharacterized protein n=1 Tax=Hibiscus sabdariffa TaxID=183260 RepID=A0ABR2F084_9ROSI